MVLRDHIEAGLIGGTTQGGAECRRVGQQPDPPAEREALASDRIDHVEQVVDSRGLHHTGRVEHLVHGSARQGRGAHIVPGRQVRLAAGGTKDDQRGAAGQPACDPGELARVAHGLQGQPDHADLFVVLPVLEGVVQGDVSTVSDSHELVQADAAGVRACQQHRRERAGLAGERDRSGLRHPGSQGEADGILPGAQEAEGAGSQQTHAVAAGAGHQFALQQATFVAVGEPLGGDQHAAHPDRGAFLNGLEAGFGAQRDHGEVDGARHVAHPGEGTAAPQLEGVTGDQVHGAAVSGVLQGGEEAAAGGIRAGGDADQQHGLRVQHPFHGSRLGAVLAFRHHGQRTGGGIDPEGDHHDAVVEHPGHVEAGLGEDLDHLGVLREHLGGELVDAVLTGGGREMLQQHRGQTGPLARVRDVERHLGRVRLGPVIAADRDDLRPDQRYQGHPVRMVDVREPFEVTPGQRRHRGEEAEVPGLFGLPLVEVLEGVGVRRQDRSQMRCGTIAQGDIRLPVGGIGGLVLIIGAGTASQ